MASGYKSLHPLTCEVLQELGVPDGHVTQGWGSAPASAGYHAVEGYYKGKRFSSCVDLRWSDDYVNPAWKSRAVAAGIIPFFRDWPGNRHIHCVHVGLRDTAGKVTILDGPRMQIVDYTRGLNGLVGHAKLTGELSPTQQERKAIRARYAAWAPSYATTVYLDGNVLRCYAWLDSTIGRVTAEVRPVVEALGFRILDTTEAGIAVRGPSGLHSTLRWEASDAVLSGEFLRAPVRSLVEALAYGNIVSYRYVQDGPDRVDITTGKVA